MHETVAVRRTYTVEEVARMLGIGRVQAYEAAKRGDFPTIRMGKRILIPRAAFDRFLDGEPEALRA
jgi:excisionase family DNA binding protein